MTEYDNLSDNELQHLAAEGNEAAEAALIDRYHPACRLEVDGGVDPVTARQVVQAGADTLVAGSAIYGAADVEGAIRALRGE